MVDKTKKAFEAGNFTRRAVYTIDSGLSVTNYSILNKKAQSKSGLRYE